MNDSLSPLYLPRCSVPGLLEPVEYPEPDAFGAFGAATANTKILTLCAVPGTALTVVLSKFTTISTCI